MKCCFIQLILIVGLISCNNINETKEPTQTVETPAKPKLDLPDSLFLSHFQILDSAAKRPPSDTMYYCCYDSVDFKVQYTRIEPDVESGYAGWDGFKPADLKKWHHWYDSVTTLK